VRRTRIWFSCAHYKEEIVSLGEWEL
jgi:hypothetical protein